MQKGFTTVVSSVLEHTSLMAYIINKVWLKQHSVVISLFDLKNAFGEVNHNLIKSVLVHCHIPNLIQVLLSAYMLISIPKLSQTAFLLQLFLLNIECFKRTALAPLYSIYASMHSSSSLSRKNVISLVFYHMMKMVAYSILFNCSSFRMMLLWLLLMNVKISCHKIVSQDGISGPTW